MWTNASVSHRQFHYQLQNSHCHQLLLLSTSSVVEWIASHALRGLTLSPTGYSSRHSSTSSASVVVQTIAVAAAVKR